MIESPFFNVIFKFTWHNSLNKHNLLNLNKTKNWMKKLLTHLTDFHGIEIMPKSQ